MCACVCVCVALAAAAAVASCVGVAARLRRYAAKMSWSRGHIAVLVRGVRRPPRSVLFYGRRDRGRVFPLRKRGTSPRRAAPDVFLTCLFLRRRVRRPLALSLTCSSHSLRRPPARPPHTHRRPRPPPAAGRPGVFPPFLRYSYFFIFPFFIPSPPPRLPLRQTFGRGFFRFLSHRLRARRGTMCNAATAVPPTFYCRTVFTGPEHRCCDRVPATYVPTSQRVWYGQHFVFAAHVSVLWSFSRTALNVVK